MAIIKRSTFEFSEKSVIKVLINIPDFYERFPVLMPNCYYQPDSEADLFCIRKSGLCDEIEVKISRSDFLKDKKKRVTYREFDDTDVFSRGEYGEWVASGRIKDTEPWKMNKLEALEAGKIVPNYFWYCIKEGICTQEDFDDIKWAGIIVISNNGQPSILKKPKRLHRRKISGSLREKVMMKGVHRYLDGLRRD